MSMTQGQYLETEVRTATPQKLHLMLVEGAIRQCHKALAAWEQEDSGNATEAIVRCQEIVTEMIAALNPEPAPDLTRRVAAIYLYIFELLTSALDEHRSEKLDEAISLLEIERQTWRELCEKLGSETNPADVPAVPAPSPQDEAAGPMDFSA